MHKRAKDWLRVALLIPVALLAPFIAVIMLLAVLFIAGTIHAEVEHQKMRSEVFEYVIENRETIEITDPRYTQYFEYADEGYIDAGVIYGYAHYPNDQYITNGKKYRNGYRLEGPTTYGNGWYYYEEICEDWYYYEEHYG